MIPSNSSFNSSLLALAKAPTSLLMGSAHKKPFEELSSAERKELSGCINSYVIENKERIFENRNDPQVQAAIYQLRDKCIALGNVKSAAMKIFDEFQLASRDLNRDVLSKIFFRTDPKTLESVIKASEAFKVGGSRALVLRYLNAEHRSLASLGIQNLKEAIQFLNSLGPEREKITYLDLQELYIKPDELKALLVDMPKLTTLKINKLTNVSIPALVPHLAKLARLDLSDSSILRDASIKAMAPHLKNLEDLSLSQCDKLTDASIMALAPHVTNLKALDLSGCANLTDASITTLAPHLKKLKALSLSNCSNLTDASITALEPHFKNMRFLNLFGCSNLTDASITAIATDLKNLQVLSLGHCTNLTDDSITAIAPYLTKLDILDLSNCSNLTDASIAELAPYIENLETALSLSNCINLTDASIIALAPHLTKLARLDLSGCKGLTRDVIKAHFSHIPELIY